LWTKADFSHISSCGYAGVYPQTALQKDDLDVAGCCWKRLASVFCLQKGFWVALLARLFFPHLDVDQPAALLFSCLQKDLYKNSSNSKRANFCG